MSARGTRGLYTETLLDARILVLIEGSADKKAAGWAKKWLLGDFRRSASASLTVTNLHTGVIAYADASDRASANKGLPSSAEKLAKYLKRKMTDDEKKFVRMVPAVAASR